MTDRPDTRTTENPDIALSDLLREVPPWRAKRHPAWTWQDEAENVKTRMCLCCGRPGHYQQTLEAHIAEHGMEGLGVYLKDGSIGDGHHRIVAAMNLGIERIPLESHDDVGARWMRDHGPVSWEDRKFGDV